MCEFLLLSFPTKILYAFHIHPAIYMFCSCHLFVFNPLKPSGNYVHHVL
jgi:hypothetical protein